MTEKTLYITDLDGTFLNSDKEISEYTRNTINTLTANGMHFSIASARSAASAVKILEGLNIEMPVVLMNGVVIYDIRQEKYIKTETISSETSDAVLGVFKRHGITGFMYAICNDKLVTYYEDLNTKALQDFYDERVRKYYKSFEKVDSFLCKTTEGNIIYFTLIGEYERLSVICKEFEQMSDIEMVLYRDIYSEHLWYMEIHSKNASKHNAVKYLREEYGFDRIIGFGDNFNDVPLFKACDLCYAVSNAVEQLKEMATGIIGDSNSDGVAKFIAEREKNRI